MWSGWHDPLTLMDIVMEPLACTFANKLFLNAKDFEFAAKKKGNEREKQNHMAQKQEHKCKRVREKKKIKKKKSSRY